MDVLQATNHTGGHQSRYDHRLREGGGDPSQNREGLLVSNIGSVGGIDGAHDPVLRGVQAPRRSRARGLVNLQICLAELVNDGQVTGTGQFLSNPHPTTPGSLEGRDVLVEHPVSPPITTDVLRLDEVHEVLVSEVRGLVLHALVHIQQHRLSDLTEDTTELLEHQHTRGLHPLELHVVTIRRLTTAEVHVNGQLEHVGQQVGLVTEEGARILRLEVHEGEQGLVEICHDLKSGFATCVDGQKFQVGGPGLLDELVVREQELVQNLIVDYAVLVGDARQHKVIHIPVGGHAQSTEHAEEGDRLLVAGQLNDHETIITSEIGVGALVEIVGRVRALLCRPDGLRRQDQEVGVRTPRPILGEGTNRAVDLRGFLVGRLLVKTGIHRILLLHQGLHRSLGLLSLPCTRIKEVVSEKLLGQEDFLCSVDDKVPTQLELAFANGVSVDPREVAQATAQHQRNLSN